MLQNIRYSVDTMRTILYQPQCRKSHIWVEDQKCQNKSRSIVCTHCYPICRRFIR